MHLYNLLPKPAEKFLPDFLFYVFNCFNIVYMAWMKRPKQRKGRRHARKSDPFYQGAPWKADRKKHLRDVDRCEDCGEEPARHSDHVIRWKIGGEVWNKRNRQGLCGRCHGSKTRKEGNGYMYDFRIGERGLYPYRPLIWIKIPKWLRGYLIKHGLESIHNGYLYRRIQGGEMKDLRSRI